MASVDVNNKLHTISQRTGITIEQVLEQYTQKRKDLADSNPTKAPEVLDSLALGATNRAVSALAGIGTNTKSIFFQGILIGLGDVEDRVESYKRRIIKEAGGETEAKAMGMLTETGQVIDHRIFGEKGQSRTYGKVLDKAQPSRTLFFLAKQKPTATGKSKDKFTDGLLPTRVEFYGNMVSGIGNNIAPHMFKPKEFRATLKTSSSEKLQRLGGTQDFKPQKIDGFTLPDADIKKLLDPHLLSQDNLEAYLSTPYKERPDFVIIRGQVSNIGARPSTNGTRLLEITSDDITSDPVTITSWVSQDIPIDFGLDSVVYLVGRPYKSKDDSYKMNVYGVFSAREDKTSPIQMPETSEVASIVWENL